MDDIVKQAMAKWPTVPDCYGWLGLDARGNWYMRDDRAQACGSCVNAVGACGHSGKRVGNAHGHIVVAVKTQFGLGLDGITYRRHAGGHVVGQHVAGRVGNVNAVGAVALHEQRLADQLLGAGHVRHHQETHGVQAQRARLADVLLRDVGLGAMGGHADGAHAQVFGHEQVVHGADARNQEGRNLGLLHQWNHGAQVFLVGVGGESVVDRAAAQAVAMGDFDQRHASGVQAAGDALHLVERHQVALGVHAVAQRHVVDGDFFTLQCHGGSR